MQILSVYAILSVERFGVPGAASNGRRLALLRPVRRRAASSALRSLEGGLPDEYIRSVTALFSNHWNLQPVHSGKQKEVAAQLP